MIVSQCQRRWSWLGCLTIVAQCLNLEALSQHVERQIVLEAVEVLWAMQLSAIQLANEQRNGVLVQILERQLALLRHVSVCKQSLEVWRLGAQLVLVDREGLVRFASIDGDDGQRIWRRWTISVNRCNEGSTISISIPDRDAIKML